MSQLIFGSPQAKRLLARMKAEFRVWDGLDFLCCECGQQREMKALHDEGGNLGPDVCDYCWRELYIDSKYDAEQIAERAEL